MLHEKVMCATAPEKVTEELLPEGGRRIVLSANFEAFENEDGSGWCGEQADFLLPADRAESAADIEESFDDWWTYAVGYDPTAPVPSLEDRVNDLESALLTLLEV